MTTKYTTFTTYSKCAWCSPLHVHRNHEYKLHITDAKPYTTSNTSKRTTREGYFDNGGIFRDDGDSIFYTINTEAMTVVRYHLSYILVIINCMYLVIYLSFH